MFSAPRNLSVVVLWCVSAAIYAASQRLPECETGNKAPTADHIYGTAARIVIAEQRFSHPLPVAQRLQSSYGTLLSSQYSIITLNLTWFHCYATSIIKAVRTSRTDHDLRQHGSSSVLVDHLQQ